MVHLVTSIWGSDKWVSCVYHMARSWRLAYGNPESKVFVGCPAPMEYNGGDLSDVGIVQVVNRNFDERFQGMRWMLHPTGVFGVHDWIVCVEADFAFFHGPTGPDVEPNKIYHMWVDGYPLFGGCATMVFDQPTHDRFISTLQGLCVAAACDKKRYPRYDVDANAMVVTMGYGDVFRAYDDWRSITKNIPNKHMGSNFDEIMFGEAVHVAMATFGMKCRDMPWEWYGVARKKWEHEESEYIEPRKKFDNHISFTKDMFPEARMVHMQGAEMIYDHRSLGRFIR